MVVVGDVVGLQPNLQ